MVDTRRAPCATARASLGRRPVTSAASALASVTHTRRAGANKIGAPSVGRRLAVEHNAALTRTGGGESNKRADQHERQQCRSAPSLSTMPGSGSNRGFWRGGLHHRQHGVASLAQTHSTDTVNTGGGRGDAVIKAPGARQGAGSAREASLSRKRGIVTYGQSIRPVA